MTARAEQPDAVQEEQCVERQAETWVGVGEQEGKNVGGVDQEQQAILWVEWSSSRQQEQQAKKRGRQREQELDEALR